MLGILIGIAVTAGGVIFYGFITEPGAEKTPPLPEKQTAVITHIAGPVFVIRNNVTIPAYPGEQLQPGDIVKVTEGAVAQVQLADKGSALLGSDTLVRFMKLTGADQKLDLRTEILTGSLSYKVEKLDDSENIVIEADGTEYEIRGTEFVIEKYEEGTILIVGEGAVQVTGRVQGGTVSVGPDEQLVIEDDEIAAEVEIISEENRVRLASSAPMPAMPFGYRDSPTPVLVEIVTYPADSDIYIDGLKTGTGKFHGLLPEGTVIDVRVRRRGFNDYAFKLTANSDQYLEINLVPSNLAETIAEEKPENPQLARLRSDYEQRLSDLQSSFNDRDSQDSAAKAEEQARIARERAEREAFLSAQLELEKTRGTVLETELADSRSENEKLRQLIQQIQELTED